VIPSEEIDFAEWKLDRAGQNGAASDVVPNLFNET
jgi:hypothetical protein